MSVEHILHLEAFRGFKCAARKIGYLEGWLLYTGQCWNSFYSSDPIPFTVQMQGNSAHPLLGTES